MQPERAPRFPFWEFPQADRETIFLVLGFCLFLLVFAVILEIIRRRRAEAARLEEAWDHVRRIIENKDIEKWQAEILFDMIAKHHPRAPLKAITLEYVFDRCVDAYMAELLAAGDKEVYARAGAALRHIRIRLGLDYVPYGARIKSSRKLAPGQVMQARPAGRKEVSWIMLTVVEVDEAYLVTAARKAWEESSPVHLRKGDSLDCQLWREDDARYRFRFTIDRVQQNPVRLFLLHAEPLRRMQARAYFRIRVNFPVTAGLITVPVDGMMEGVSELEPSGWISARVTSLSAGGLALETEQTVSSHVLLRIPLELPGNPPVSLTAQVVGVSPLQNSRFLLRAQFVDISEEEREILAHYVLQRQLPKSDDEEDAQS